ncbi:MAG: nucleoside-diphosphate kinase [Elusimicrobiota bacterium]
MGVEKTLIIIKPDALSKRLVGRVITKIEQDTNLKIIGLKMIRLSREEARKFYIEHKGKDFYEHLVNFIISNPILVMVVKGPEAIQKMRDLMGETHPDDADRGTVRKRWAQDGRHNIIHGSDSPSSAAREIEFFFPDDKDLYEWKKKEYPIV